MLGISGGMSPSIVLVKPHKVVSLCWFSLLRSFELYMLHDGKVLNSRVWVWAWAGLSQVGQMKGL